MLQFWLRSMWRLRLQSQARWRYPMLHRKLFTQTRWVDQLLHLYTTDVVYYTSSTTAIAATTIIAATSITTALAPTSITTALAASHEPLPRRRLPHAGGHQPALRHVLRRAERWRPNLVDVPGRHVGRRAVHHAGRGAPALRERRDLHGLRLVREHRDE